MSYGKERKRSGRERERDMERQLHEEKYSARDRVLEIDEGEEKQGVVMIEKHKAGGLDKR